MATEDQLLYSTLQSTAMRYAAERRNLQESIEELRRIADGRDEVIAEAAGITAGAWYAWPSTHAGYELVAAGMLIMAAGRDAMDGARYGISDILGGKHYEFRVRQP